MTFTPSPTAISFDDAQIWIELEDGHTLGVPLIWFPRLLRATPEQPNAFFLSAHGIHWDEIDEDISIAGSIADRVQTMNSHQTSSKFDSCRI